MVNKIQLLRSNTSGSRPAVAAQSPGVPYVNFADKQLGIVDPSQTPQDLIGVPFFSATANYNPGQPVNFGGNLYIAKVAITAGAWNAANWNQVIAATAAEYIANSAPGKIVTPGTVWAAAAAYVTLSGLTAAPDLSSGIDFFWTLAGACTLNNPTNLKAGQKGLIIVQQDPTGSRLMTWGSSYKFPGGVKPILSTAAGSTDIISYFASGSAGSPFMYCTFVAGFA